MRLPTFTAVRVSPSPTALCIAVFIVAYTSLGVAARNLQQSSACTSGVDVTGYGADASGQSDSSQAFNEAIVAASAERLFVCVPPGTYKALADIDVNVDGLLVSAPSGASIVFGASNVQFFVRGNGNTVQNLNINCDNSAASGFVITGGGNVVTGCSRAQVTDGSPLRGASPKRGEVKLRKIGLWQDRWNPPDSQTQM
ncbi:hypothetical protein WJX82_002254 [Trebouxia sp. C0006]